MVKDKHIFKKEDIIYVILSNTDGMIVYRKLGFPHSQPLLDERTNFELRVKNGEFKKIEGKIIPEYSNSHISELLYVGKIYRNKNTLYKIISNYENMIVFQELYFSSGKLFQTSHSNFLKKIELGIIKERSDRYVEVGDRYLIARSSIIFKIKSIDKKECVVKRYFENDGKICTEYDPYHFFKDVNMGKFILIEP